MTLSVHVSDALEPLAEVLLGQLAEPLADPMQPELVAVPSEGMRRWLRLRLARELGSQGTGDGIAANIDMPFPGVLRARLLLAGTDPGEDPWMLERTVWTIRRLLDEHRHDPGLRALAELPDGATWYGRARRIADLFDRYLSRRPSMIRAWLDGALVGPQGAPLPERFGWQPHLFGLVRAAIGQPSPAERLPELLHQVADGRLAIDLPPRFGFFGLSTLPGGSVFADLVRAFGVHHDVTVYLLDPAPATTERLVAEGWGRRAATVRAEDRSPGSVRQPLLRSWSRPAREAQLLLRRMDLPEPVVHRTDADAPPAHLLAQLQRHLRTDRPAEPLPAAGDGSITVHACVGPVRQVEALRDQILAALRDDPTLGESDILVVCPDLVTFAPLIPGVFGPSADAGPGAGDGPPMLRYTISDRELRAEDAVGGAIAALGELVGSRYNASQLLDFIGLPPVRAAFGFDDDALDQIERWVEQTAIRWGLNEANRSRNELPGLRTNTWRFGMRQLLAGMAIGDDEPVMGPGDLPAWGVEGSGVDTLNRLLSLIGRLEAIEERWAVPAVPAEWNQRLAEAVNHLFDVPFHDRWQLERARAAFDEIVANAGGAGAGAVELSLSEVRQVLDESLRGRPGRSRFFDGGITFTSLRPLRWVPFRMIGVLGLDDGSLVGPSADGDDVLIVKPELGDPDRRSDQRQALLEAVLAAGDRLVITRTGHDLRTNAEVPHGIALAELLTEIASLVPPADRHDLMASIEQRHTRHAFHRSNFAAGSPSSFDPRALAAAQALIGSDPAPAYRPAVLAAPEGRPLLRDDLKEVLLNGPRYFVRHRLEARITGADQGPSDLLPVETDHLQDWETLSNFLEALHSGQTWEHVAAILRARGLYPAGVTGEQSVRGLGELAKVLHALVAEQTGGAGAETIDLDVEIGGEAIGGKIDGIHPHRGVGPVITSASRLDNRQIPALWVDLCLLTIHDPTIRWIGVAVGKPEKRNAKPEAERWRMRVRGETALERVEAATEALGLVRALARTGLCEPLPVFAKVGVKNGFPEGWTDGRFADMANDPSVLMTFGRLSAEGLLDIPARPQDPGEPAITSRFLRLTDAIETAIERSVSVEKDWR